MSGKYLLDTNIVIALFQGDSIIEKNIDQALEIFLPSTVLGELYYGAYNSNRQKTNLERIDSFKSNVSILYVDDTTAHFYGQIKKGLKAKGRPIPENDIWIAGVAIQYELTLITRDRHFEYIDNLNVDVW